MKVSSAYTQTWANGQGQWYETNDPDANPNGVLYGNWTQTTVVHGNGEPKQRLRRRKRRRGQLLVRRYGCSKGKLGVGMGGSDTI